MKTTRSAARAQQAFVATAPSGPDKPAAGLPGRQFPLSPGVVKSAGRIIQILELFDDLRRQANVVEVAAALDYPQSSASALLRSLVALGYLHYDARKRTYCPTERVALLGNWVSPVLFRDGTLARVMDDLQRRTGLEALLVGRNGEHAQVLLVKPGKAGLTRTFRKGQLEPLALSSLGRVLLSALPDAEVRRIAHRINAEAPSAQEVVMVADLVQALRGIRALGYLYEERAGAAPQSIVAVRLPPDASSQPLALVLSGPTSILKPRRQMAADLMRETLRRAFSPAAVPVPQSPVLAGPVRAGAHRPRPEVALAG
jgi:DNA-binding IclR family transcriptional regulator